VYALVCWVNMLLIAIYTDSRRPFRLLGVLIYHTLLACAYIGCIFACVRLGCIRLPNAIAHGRPSRPMKLGLCCSVG
jgi:hypothetical protein